jgi:1,4-dihydroxy-2-naphthoate polyprenyltransferase
MNKIRLWAKAIRAPFYTATIIPIVLGAVIAWSEIDHFRWGYFILALAGGILIHTGVNLANDYFDHLSRNDWNNKTPTPFSGGSRLIQNNLLKPYQFLLASLICFGLGSAIGLYLNHVLTGNVILYLGIIGVFLGFFYTATPIQIGYKGFGLGELAVGLGFGPLMVLGSYYVQAQQISLIPILASIPVMILIALVVYINEFPDYEADKSVNKRTLPVILGTDKASYIFSGFFLMAYFLTILFVIMEILPALALLTLLTLPLAIKAIKIARKHNDKVTELLPANMSTIAAHFAFGACLIIAYVIDNLIL